MEVKANSGKICINSSLGKSQINEIEKEILKFWEKNKIFEKSLKKTEKKKPYIFYDGPPFATGMPHYGHILGSVTKDVYGIFWCLERGYRKNWEMGGYGKFL